MIWCRLSPKGNWFRFSRQHCFFIFTNGGLINRINAEQAKWRQASVVLYDSRVLLQLKGHFYKTTIKTYIITRSRTLGKKEAKR